MKIFFMIAIQGKTELESNYRHILDKIKGFGHQVTSEYLFDVEHDTFEKGQDSQELLKLHKRIIDDIKRSDLFVVEVSHQRLSLGYWISLAMELGKPTVALCQSGEKYHLLETLELNQKFTLYEYKSTEELDKELPLLIDFAAEQQDTRFNFFISPNHQNYLDWIAKHRKIPRSVYLRNLIEHDIEQNTEFSESKL